MRKTAPWHDVDYYYDAAGRMVFLGERVAYNLSGSVAVGKVRRIRVQAWRIDRRSPHDPHRIEIEYEKGHYRYRDGKDHVSTITRPSNSVTLEHYVLGGGNE